MQRRVGPFAYKPTYWYLKRILNLSLKSCKVQRESFVGFRGNLHFHDEAIEKFVGKNGGRICSWKRLCGSN